MTNQIYQNPVTSRDKTINKIQMVLIEIRLGTSRYLIDSDFVKEFKQIREYSPVYDAPSYVKGVTLIEEERVPVINVTSLLGAEAMLKDEEEESREVAIILSKGKIIESDIAVIVDRVQNLIKIEKDQILEANISGVEGIQDFVKGIIRTQGIDGKEEMLLYLNLEKLLTELLHGRISCPSPGLYIWRWIHSKQDEETRYGQKNIKSTRKKLW